MKIALYISTNKKRELEIAEALIRGFVRHGDETMIMPTSEYDGPLPETQLAVMVGVKGQSKKIFEEHRKAGRHTLFIDKSYFGRRDYYRLSLDGFQPAYAHAQNRSPDRFETLGVKLLPKRKRGKHIVYAGSSQKYCDWHDLGDVNAFAMKICQRISKRTQGVLPIYYRPKPSWAAGHPEDVQPVPNTIYSSPQQPFTDLLPNCHALVTHGSNAAIEAIAAGVPVVLASNEGASAAWRLAEKDFENGIAAPHWPSDDLRLQVFSNLAWCQFTLPEIASGLAWETLIPYTIKRLDNVNGMDEQQKCIELYKIMHENEKMFRGGSLQGHTEAVRALVKEFAPATLLDYGSGKGRQYADLKLHDEWGGLEPTCYDPGYPPFAEKPAGKFDGVICTDVAEHIAEEYVPEFLDDVVGYANQFVFLCIFTNKARKNLPDGRNCHLTVRPPRWWIEQLVRAGDVDQITEVSVAKTVGGVTADFMHYRMDCRDGRVIVVTFRGEE